LLAYLLSTPVEPMPNARHELRLEAGARYERTLEAVSSMPLLGPYWRPEAWKTVPDTFLFPEKGCDAHNGHFGRLILRNGRLFRSCVTEPGAVT
jgi:hypothetical protein